MRSIRRCSSFLSYPRGVFQNIRGLHYVGFRRRKLQRASGNLSVGITTTLVVVVEEGVETMGAAVEGGVDRISTDMNLRRQVIVHDRMI